MHQLRLRAVLALIPVGMLAAAAVAWMSWRPILVLPSEQSVYGLTDVFMGPFPFWASTCLMVGFTLLLLVLAVRQVKDTLFWAAPLFFLMWMLDSAGAVNINVIRRDSMGDTVSLNAASSTVTLLWWGLVLLALMVVAIAVGSRVSRSQSGASSHGRTGATGQTSDASILEEKPGFPGPA